MRVTKSRFLISAGAGAEYPRGDLPEVAFLGRSNVGKSSLISVLAGRRGLARASRTPGRTRRAHFYSINDEILFVDLPGYGYARVPGRARSELREIIDSYLTARRPLVAAVLIVDSRHEPSELDVGMNTWLEDREIPVLLVSTKVDKVSRSRQGQSLSCCRRLLGRDEIVKFSSETGEGKRELWQAIDRQIAVRNSLKQRR